MADQEKEVFQFDRQNYIFLIIGVALVFLGMLLMTGGAPETPEQFNPDVFSFRRITLAPVVILAGFGVVMYSILKKPKKE